MNPVVEALPVQTGERKRVRILETLQTLDRPEIFALGDIAEGTDVEGRAIPNTAQAAFQQASYCAWNIWALATAAAGRELRPLLAFCYMPLGEMLSLGKDSASLSGLGIALDGPLGYLARRLVYLFRLPTIDHQLKVGWSWASKTLPTEWNKCVNKVGKKAG